MVKRIVKDGAIRPFVLILIYGDRKLFDKR